MPPAVEGVQQAHIRALVVRGAGLDYRAYKHLQQTSAYSIDANRDEQARKRTREQLREKAQPQQSRRGKQLRQFHAGPVTQPVNVQGACKVRQQLHAKIHGHQQRELFKGYAEAPLHCQKQQRQEVVHDGLGHKAEIAGQFYTSVIHGGPFVA